MIKLLNILEEDKLTRSKSIENYDLKHLIIDTQGFDSIEDYRKTLPIYRGVKNGNYEISMIDPKQLKRDLKLIMPAR